MKFKKLLLAILISIMLLNLYCNTLYSEIDLSKIPHDKIKRINKKLNAVICEKIIKLKSKYNELQNFNSTSLKYNAKRPAILKYQFNKSIIQINSIISDEHYGYQIHSIYSGFYKRGYLIYDYHLGLYVKIEMKNKDLENKLLAILDKTIPKYYDVDAIIKEDNLIIDLSSGIHVKVEPDGQTVTATDKDSKKKWSINIIKKFGVPAIGKPKIKCFAINKDYVSFIIEKHGSGRINIDSGDVEFSVFK